jgi:hypothetical protein
MKSAFHSQIPFLPFLLNHSITITTESLNSLFYMACNPRYIASGRPKQKTLFPNNFFIVIEPFYPVVTSISLAAGMCLQSRCLVMDVFSSSTIPTFWCHITVSYRYSLTTALEYIILKRVLGCFINLNVIFIFSVSKSVDVNLIEVNRSFRSCSLC